MTYRSDINLEGSLVVLRRMKAEHLTSEYVRWLNDPEVVKFSNQRFREHTLESSKNYLDLFIGSDNFFLSIAEINSGRVCGSITAYRDLNHGTADMGLMVGDRSVWGRGYGLEAWKLLMQYLFSSGGVRKVTGGTLASNIGMLKIMERSGMELEAVKKKQEIIDGVPMDIHYYAKFRDS